MNNKRKLTDDHWKNSTSKKRPEKSSAGFRSIQDFLLPSSSRVNEPEPEPAQPASTDVATDVTTRSDSASASVPLPEYCRFVDDATNLSHTGLPLNDIGYAVKIIQDNAYSLTESDKYHFLISRWQPQTKEVTSDILGRFFKLLANLFAYPMMTS
jgi:hypothetical protein